MPEQIFPREIDGVAQMERFALAGKATFTLRSKRTGQRFTFKVSASDDGALHFVSLMTGSDNEESFQYLGIIRDRGNGPAFQRTAKSRISADAPSAKAFAWFWHHVAARKAMPEIEFWHEGRCGRCNRKLTVPESIASGFGPECVGRVGQRFMAEAA